MRSILSIFILSLATSALAGVQDFSLKNETGFIITALKVSPTSQSTWGPDILGTDVLGLGETSNINIEESDECLWDVKITEAKDDGSTKDWTVTALDLCSVSVLTFKVSGGKVVYTKE